MNERARSGGRRLARRALSALSIGVAILLLNPLWAALGLKLLEVATDRPKIGHDPLQHRAPERPRGYATDRPEGGPHRIAERSRDSSDDVAIDDDVAATDPLLVRKLARLALGRLDSLMPPAGSGQTRSWHRTEEPGRGSRAEWHLVGWNLDRPRFCPEPGAAARCEPPSIAAARVRLVAVDEDRARAVAEWRVSGRLVDRGEASFELEREGASWRVTAAIASKAGPPLPSFVATVLGGGW